MTLRLNQTSRAWIAGLFDGEGCVTTQKGKHGPRVRVVLGMTHKETVKKLHNYFGGSFREVIRNNDKHKNYFVWTITPPRCYSFLEAIEPFSVTKKRQIQVGLKFKELAVNPKTGDRYWGATPPTPRTKKARTNLGQRLKRLNVRGKKQGEK